jgi:hypothetical protein
MKGEKMSIRICPKCGKPLLKVTKGKLAEVRSIESVLEAQGGVKWETYTCQTKDCPHHNRTFVWDVKKNTWKRLP